MLLFQEGMDNYNSITEFWKLRDARPSERGGTYDSTGGVYGGGAFRANVSDLVGVRLPLLAPIAANLVRAAFWVKTNQTGSIVGSRPVFALGDHGNTRAWQFYVTGAAGSGKLQCARFDDDLTPGSMFFTTSATVGDNAYHHIELQLSAHTSTGTLKIWVDGVLDINITAGDTSDAVSGDVTIFDYVQFGGCSSNAAGSQVWIDDPIVWDDQGSGFTGHLPDKHRIRVTAPNADGAVSDFTPSTGSNYQCVDDVLSDDDTTFVESSTVGDQDRYSFSAVGFSPGLIYAAIVESSSCRTGIKAMNVRGVAELGGTDQFSSVQVVTPGYLKNQLVLELAPDGSDWTAQKAIASEFGVEYYS